MGSNLAILAAVAFCFSVSNLVFYGHAIESVMYTLVRSESDYEIRLYREVSWMSALVRETSFEKSTKDGFQRTLYYVKLFLSKRNPPEPNPELNLQLETWNAQCMAIRKFSGFAKDDNVKKEMEALVTSLTKHPTGNTVLDYNISYTIAQYNSSHHTSGRLNEVWIDVSGFNMEGCLPKQGKY
ncbi:hypothetical protein GH714_028421 [Hevea brasiliensis]|uniref:Uncharacterized protein n=1 Tax=Hevea brasiliensis TaxID=3981 RepID=A0A6A6LJK0_HEVBR|nr:hypothetical protein GH714_028421 [Hevea brasiliensis]